MVRDLNKIVLRHTSIVINNYEWDDSTRLQDYFKIFDPTTHQHYYKGIIYDEEKKQLILPRGLDIYLLENIFECKAVVDYSYDEYDLVEPILIQYLPRDDNQKQTLRFVLGEGEYQCNKSKSQICVNNNTGTGKTYIASATISYTLLKTIVIASTKGIIEQWVDRLMQYTNLAAKDICIIEGSGTIRRLFKRGADKYKIFLVTHATISTYASNYGWDAVGELFKFLKVGFKVIDEYHQCFDNIVYIDAYTNTYRSLYLSATPLRSNDRENIIYQYAYKNIPSIDLFDEDKDPHTAYIGIRFSSKPSPQKVSECKNQYGLDRNKYIDYVVYQEEFHLLLHYLTHIIKNTNGKVLIYIGTNKGILAVHDWIVENYPELRTKIGIYTSIITDNKKEQLDKKIILSTTKSCGAAMDISGLKKTILLAEPFKSEVLARQSLGRTRDNDTVYIEVVDVGFRQIVAFYNHKKPVFEKYATSCKESTLGHNVLVDKVSQLMRRRAQMKQPIIFNEPGESFGNPLIKYKEGELKSPLIKYDSMG